MTMNEESCCRSLVYQVFLNPATQIAGRGKVVAFAAAHPKAGVSYVVQSVARMLNEDSPESAVVVEARSKTQIGTGASGPLPDPHNGPYAQKTAGASKAANYGIFEWRSRPQDRAAHIAALSRLYQDVLLDCPATDFAADLMAIA